MTIYDSIRNLIHEAVQAAGFDLEKIHLEHPTEFSFGDLSTNVAMVLAKQAGTSPRELADKFVAHMSQAEIGEIEKIEVAGPGFINITLSLTSSGDTWKNTKATVSPGS